jgi:DNA repair protein RecN (Recombination protein N)
VVTHLAQVAAFADRHLVVSRATDEEGVRTCVVVAEGTDRVVEVARMLSGNDSQAGRDHAEELLAAARSVVTER